MNGLLIEIYHDPAKPINNVGAGVWYITCTCDPDVQEGDAVSLDLKQNYHATRKSGFLLGRVMFVVDGKCSVQVSGVCRLKYCIEKGLLEIKVGIYVNVCDGKIAILPYSRRGLIMAVYPESNEVDVLL